MGCERAHSEHNVPLEATDAIASLADLEPDGFRYAILFLARLGVEIDNALNRAWAAQQAMHRGATPEGTAPMPKS